MHKVTLNWNPPVVDPTHDAAVSYIVQRSNKVDGPWTDIGAPTTPSFVDNNVNAGETWFYQILAKNQSASSAPSNEVTVLIPFLAPGAPLSLVAVPE
jgi:hypothetical protein